MNFVRFEGTWTLERAIEDRRAGQESQMTGTVVFVADGVGYRVHERGKLCLPDGAMLPADRTYFWRRDSFGIAVLFADGRPFHVFAPVDGRAEARHDCTPDTYRVEYDFVDDDCWHARWTVRGPRKDYVMTTRHGRARW